MEPLTLGLKFMGMDIILDRGIPDDEVHFVAGHGFANMRTIGVIKGINMGTERLQLTEREVKELILCLVYAEDLSHGTDGHNRMLLVAKLATALGISRPASDVNMIDGDFDIVKTPQR